MTVSKRRHFRHKTFLTAQLRVRGSFSWLGASVHNLSKSGILIECESDKVIAVGDTVEIEFKTTDKLGSVNQRRFIGRTVWRRGVRYGIEFQAKTKVKG
ncbi:MAG: PilZ domain-containing protein [Bdellovibrionota bacterium]